MWSFAWIFFFTFLHSSRIWTFFAPWCEKVASLMRNARDNRLTNVFCTYVIRRSHLLPSTLHHHFQLTFLACSKVLAWSWTKLAKSNHRVFVLGCLIKPTRVVRKRVSSFRRWSTCALLPILLAAQVVNWVPDSSFPAQPPLEERRARAIHF